MLWDIPVPFRQGSGECAEKKYAPSRATPSLPGRSAHLPNQTCIPDQACCRTRLLQSGVDLIHSRTKLRVPPPSAGFSLVPMSRRDILACLRARLGYGHWALPLGVPVFKNRGDQSIDGIGFGFGVDFEPVAAQC